MASFSFRFYAARDIVDGEELTTAYCNIREPRAERHEALQMRGFSCACPACKDVDSDKRCAMITRPDYTYIQLFGPTEGPEAEEQADRDEPSNLGSTQRGDSPKKPTREEAIEEPRRQIALIEREGLEVEEYYMGHLYALSRILDQTANVAEVEDLKSKWALLKQTKGKVEPSQGAAGPQETPHKPPKTVSLSG